MKDNLAYHGFRHIVVLDHDKCSWLWFSARNRHERHHVTIQPVRTPIIRNNTTLTSVFEVKDTQRWGGADTCNGWAAILATFGSPALPENT